MKAAGALLLACAGCSIVGGVDGEYQLAVEPPPMKPAADPWAVTLAARDVKPQGLAVSDAGIYVVGGYLGERLDIAEAPFGASTEGQDMFAARLDPVGGAPVHVAVFPGDEHEVLRDVVVDEAGTPWVAGRCCGDQLFGDNRCSSLLEHACFAQLNAELDVVDRLWIDDVVSDARAIALAPDSVAVAVVAEIGDDESFDCTTNLGMKPALPTYAYWVMERTRDPLMRCAMGGNQFGSYWTNVEGNALSSVAVVDDDVLVGGIFAQRPLILNNMLSDGPTDGIVIKQGPMGTQFFDVTGPAPDRVEGFILANGFLYAAGLISLEIGNGVQLHGFISQRDRDDIMVEVGLTTFGAGSHARSLAAHGDKIALVGDFDNVIELPGVDEPVVPRGTRAAFVAVLNADLKPESIVVIDGAGSDVSAARVAWFGDRLVVAGIFSGVIDTFDTPMACAAGNTCGFVTMLAAL